MSSYYKIKNMYHSIVNCGTQGNVTNEDKRRIVISNKILIILMGFASPFIVFFYYLKLYPLSLALFLTVASFIIYMYCNFLKIYNVPRIGIILTSNSAILYSSYLLGQDSGIHLVLFIMTILPFVLFDPKEKRIITCLVMFSLLSFSFLTAYHQLFFKQHYVLEPVHMNMIYLMMISTVISISIFIVIAYIQTNKEYENELKKTVENLKSSKSVQEKMIKQSTYAKLLRGISHELKNPMNMISLGAQSILVNLHDKERIKKSCALTVKNIQRLKAILHTMLTFGSEGSSERQYISINSTINSIILMAQAFFKEKKIKIQTNLHEIPDIMVNENQIQQTLMNIVVNACESMTQGGNIMFETNRIQFRKHDSLDTINGIYIKISDSGSGISPENLDKIFDPFFTTKKENSGIGLAMCLKYISSHGGTLDVNSEIGKGTTFTIYLPIVPYHENILCT